MGTRLHHLSNACRCRTLLRSLRNWDLWQNTRARISFPSYSKYVSRCKGYNWQTFANQSIEKTGSRPPGLLKRLTGIKESSLFQYDWLYHPRNTAISAVDSTLVNNLRRRICYQKECKYSVKGRKKCHSTARRVTQEKWISYEASTSLCYVTGWPHQVLQGQNAVKRHYNSMQLNTSCQNWQDQLGDYYTNADLVSLYTVRLERQCDRWLGHRYSTSHWHPMKISQLPLQ